MRILASIAAVLLCAAASQSAQAGELLTNGDFETGDFTGWTVTDAGSGAFYVDVPGTTTPFSGQATAANPGGGRWYAVSDQGGGGTHALTQTFVVPVGVSSVVLSFEMFVNNQSVGGTIVGPGLDHTSGVNQHGRVDILTAGATAFDTGAGVLGNLYIGADAGANPNPWTPYVFDITGLVGGGGTFQLRFAESDNQFFFNQGVDNVSIETRGAAVPLPPAAWMGLGLLGLAGAVRRRRRAS